MELNKTKIMKSKILVLTVLMGMLSFTTVMAQEQSNENKETRSVYCQVVVSQKFMSSKMKMHVDYGEKTSWIGPYEKVRDEQSGKVQAFNSQVDALNYMTEEGWNYITSYVVVSTSGMSTQVEFYYLLSREIPMEGY